MTPTRASLLSKNGPTNDCLAAGAEITGVAGFRVDSGFYLGFDYRNGTHCRGGAPRFNVTWHDNNGTPFFSFLRACENAAITVRSQAVQDPLQWTTSAVRSVRPGQPAPKPLHYGCDVPLLPRRDHAHL